MDRYGPGLRGARWGRGVARPADRRGTGYNNTNRWNHLRQRPRPVPLHPPLRTVDVRALAADSSRAWRPPPMSADGRYVPLAAGRDRSLSVVEVGSTGGPR